MMADLPSWLKRGINTDGISLPQDQEPARVHNVYEKGINEGLWSGWQKTQERIEELKRRIWETSAFIEHLTELQQKELLNIIERVFK